MIDMQMSELKKKNKLLFRLIVRHIFDGKVCDNKLNTCVTDTERVCIRLYFKSSDKSYVGYSVLIVVKNHTMKIVSDLMSPGEKRVNMQNPSTHEKIKKIYSEDSDEIKIFNILTNNNLRGKIVNLYHKVHHSDYMQKLEQTYTFLLCNKNTKYLLHDLAKIIAHKILFFQ
jgi:hypothetical protein